MSFGALSAAHPEDLYRAAWNQAVSALDHWLHREIINRAVILTNDRGRQRPSALQRLQMPFAMVERMRDEPAHKVFREYLEDELGRIAYQKSQRITEGLRLVLPGTSSRLWSGIGGVLGMPPEAVKARQDAIVNRRNRIAYEADLDPQGNRTPMTAEDAQATAEWIHRLATAIAHVLG